jgi:hypothetical protein
MIRFKQKVQPLMPYVHLFLNEEMFNQHIEFLIHVFHFIGL